MFHFKESLESDLVDFERVGVDHSLIPHNFEISMKLWCRLKQGYARSL